jgi:hypothetical protein
VAVLERPGQLHARLDILCLLHNIDNIRTIPLQPQGGCPGGC